MEYYIFGVKGKCIAFFRTTKNSENFLEVEGNLQFPEPQILHIWRLNNEKIKRL